MDGKMGRAEISDGGRKGWIGRSDWKDERDWRYDGERRKVDMGEMAGNTWAKTIVIDMKNNI